MTATSTDPVTATVDVQALLSNRAAVALAADKAQEAQDQAERAQAHRQVTADRIAHFLTDVWNLAPEQAQLIIAHADLDHQLFNIGTWQFQLNTRYLAVLVVGVCPICGAPIVTWPIGSLGELGSIIANPDPESHPTCDCILPINQAQHDTNNNPTNTWWGYLCPATREAAKDLVTAVMHLIDLQQ